MARKKLAQTLSSRPITQAGEIVLVFAAALAVIRLAGPLAGEDPLARQGVVWVANVVMLAIVWLGLRLRGQRWDHLGLAIRPADARSVFRTVVSSFGVFVAAVAAFLLGAIVTALVVGQPEPADFSGYNYLAGNLPLLLLALGGVYIVSSFGEEVIYRAFLMNRLAEMGAGTTSAWRLAVVTSAVVFGLVHYTWGPTGMVQTGFMGLALSVSYLAVRRNLWVLILAHAYMDTGLLVQMYFGSGGAGS